MKKNSSFIVKLILALILTSFACATAQVTNVSQENIHKQKVVIGIRAFAGADMVYQEWNETINHLNKTIPNYEFKVLPLVDYEEIKNKVKNKDMDFYIGDPASYIEMESLYGMTRLATLQRKKDGLYFDKFGAVIFTASKNKDINTFADFKDKVLMGVSESAFAGYRVGYREMTMHGIKPEKVFKNILFSGGRGDDVVKEVLANENYVGIIRTGLVEAMIQQGAIKKEDIRVINSIDYTYFPLMVSTKLYPEFPFARLSHIPEELGKKVLISLLSIQEDSTAAKSGKYARWLIPNDYTDVTNLMKDLNVGIFKDINKVTLEKVIQEYWLVISMLFVFIIVLIVFAIRIKIQESTIREHKDKLKKIVDIQDSIVLLFDGKKILDCNLRLYQFFNLSHLKEFSQRFINIGDIFEESEFYLQKKHNSQIWYEYIVGSPHETHKVKIKDYEGVDHIFKINVAIYDTKHLLYVVTLHDITMIEHLQEQNRKNEKLLHEQKKLASMGEMIGNIAHQWRQPLSVISTNATGLKMQLEFGVEFTTDEIIQYCEDINNQAQYLSKTIDDFRNFIKNDKNKAEFKVSDILNETISLITASIASEHIEIIKDYQCDCTVSGYPNEMIQALMNIINNSKDAIKNNQTSHDPRHIFIETRSFNNQVEIYIKDNGGGIPDDVKDKVFEPYFTTKHQSQGTGIGLYMTRQIIVGHNDGKISAHNIEFEYKNVLHKGAVIAIVLPCVAN